jgi:hypothetical protein
MRPFAYALCAILVAIPAIYGLLASFLGLLKVSMPFPPWFTLFYSFGSLVPPMLAGLMPPWVMTVLGYGVALLVLRRIWLFVARKERTPSAFAGLPKMLGYIGFWSFSVGVAVLVLSALLKAGSGVPAGMLMIPAVICIPWAFFLTEIISFRKSGAHAT